jgi:hypothetical protein
MVIILQPPITALNPLQEVTKELSLFGINPCTHFKSPLPRPKSDEKVLIVVVGVRSGCATMYEKTSLPPSLMAETIEIYSMLIIRPAASYSH